MFDIQDLYQQVIIDHNKHPRNFHAMQDCTAKAEGFNPLCGDRLTLYLKIDEDGIIRDISFEGKGCAISTASASLMTEHLKGMHVRDAENVFHRFHDFLVNSGDSSMAEALGKLTVLAGVKRFPSRIKCATLCWHTLEAALHGKGKASTEGGEDDFDV